MRYCGHDSCSREFPRIILIGNSSNSRKLVLAGFAITVATIIAGAKAKIAVAVEDADIIATEAAIRSIPTNCVAVAIAIVLEPPLASPVLQ